VGTNLVTAHDHPALDGVYKLSALRDENNQWVYKIKLSEQVEKVSNPGIYQVRRFFIDEQFVLDALYDVELGIPELPRVVSLTAPHTQLRLGDYDAFVDLLQPIFVKGELVYQQDSIHDIRKFAIQEVSRFVQAHKDEKYSVGLEENLHALKQGLITEVASSIYERE
jgi:nicotinate phosphoribosyltransferase